MYSTVIEIKNDVTSDVLSQLKKVIEGAFSNRVGTVANISKIPHRFEFVGGEGEYGCLEVGMLNLKREQNFLPYVSAWQWVDDDPDECCDLLKLFTKKR